MKKKFTRFFCALLCIPLLISFHSKAQSGQGLSFSPNQFATLPANILEGIGTGSFTIEAWVYWRGGGNWQRIFDIGTGTDNYMYLSVSGNPSGVPGTQEITFGFKMAPYFERRVTSAAPMPVRVWTHIAVTVDYTDPLLPQAYLYVNGVKTGPSPQGMLDFGGTGTPYTAAGLGATTNNWLGRSQYVADPYFNGVIDELRISNTLQYTSNFTPATTLSPTGATALYHFEDAPGSQTAANSIAPGPGPIILGSTTTVEPTEDPTFTVLATLPVFILQFDAHKTGKAVVLNWKVFSTGEGGQFVIERSTDGMNFQPVGTKAIPATQGTFSFGFEDYSYSSGKNYYRLKVMENYAPVKYSAIVSVEGEALFTAYPTITSSQIFIRIPQATTIAIYSTNGLLMKKMKLASSQNVDVSRLSKGSYQIFFEGSNETVRFVKL